MRRVAEPLGLELSEAARGIHRLANASMMRALRAVSTERGRDPREFVLVATAAPALFCRSPGRRPRRPTAVVPPLAGLFSSAGLLFARTEFHDVRFCRVDARRPDLAQLRGLEDEMRSGLSERVEGSATVEWLRSADAPLPGANWSITVDVPGETGAIDTDVVIERFEAEHERQYGTRLEPGPRCRSGPFA